MDPAEDLPSTSSIPDLLSGAEVEQIFGRSARTLRRWEQQGYLRPVRIGGAKFYRANDIRRLISDQLEKAMHKPTGAAKARRDKPP